MYYRVLVLLLVFFNAKGQVISGARFMGMGNAGVAMEDAYSLVNNPAGAANLKLPVLSVSFQEPFLGVDIHSQSALCVFPFELGVLGYSVSRYGIPKAYSNLKSGLTLARAFGSQLAMAITVNYHQLKIPAYGLDNAFTVEFGLQYKLKEQWIIGAHVDNIGRFNYENENYYSIPTVLSVGNSFQFSDQVLISVDGKYLLNEHFDGSLGIEYSIVQWLKLRGGVSFNHFQQYVGFGFSYQDFLFDAATAVHSRLGISPQISLSYAF